MLRTPLRKSKHAGFTLLSALSFTILVSTLLAGAATIATSHYNRAKVEGSYASAIALADAGVNYELAWLSRDITDASRAHQQGSPYTGSIPGAPGTFQVYVKDWGTDCNGGTWSQPNDICVVSTGTVNGISRTVRVRSIRKSIFEEYVIYAYSIGIFNGGGTSATATQVVGNTGTNGSMTFNGSTNTDTIVGSLDLNGSAASSSDPGTNVRTNPDAVKMPSVTQVADKTFPAGGLTWLKTNNSNASIRRLNTLDPTWLAEPSVAGITLADVNALPSAGFTTASTTFGDPPATVPTDSSTRDDSSSSSANWRFVQPADATYGISAYGIKGKRVYLVPPGDYYFNRFDVKAGTSALVFLTHLGRIRIWVDQATAGSVPDDNLSVPAIFTDTSPNKFRFYYNKCATLHMGGNAKFNGSFYAMKTGCVSATPELDFTGNSMIYGAMIANKINLGGGTKVIFPNNGGDTADMALWYGFGDNWKEISLTANPVFPDGTSN